MNHTFYGIFTPRKAPDRTAKERREEGKTKEVVIISNINWNVADSTRHDLESSSRARSEACPKPMAGHGSRFLANSVASAIFADRICTYHQQI